MFPNSSKAWGNSSLWGNGSLSNGFTSRVHTRDNSRTPDGSPTTPGDSVGEIEGKTGSKSLLEGTSALKDDWGLLSPQHYGIQQPQPASRPDKSASQQMSFSVAGPPPPLPGAGQNLTSLASKPPSISLNQTSSTHSRLDGPAGFGSGITGRTYDPPVTVYTKFDRAERPAHPAKKADSAVGFWTDGMNLPSPTEERRLQFNAPYNANTPPSSQDVRPSPSQHSDEQSSFANGPFFAHSTDRTTPNSTRAPSISSQSNGTYGSSALQSPQDLTSPFGQLSVRGNHRPSTSHRPTKSANGYVSRVTGSGSAPLSARTPANGVANGSDRSDGAKKSNRSSVQSLGSDGLTSPQPASAFSDYTSPAFGGRLPQPPGSGNFRNNQPFTTPGGGDPHAYFDPRLQHLLQLRSPYTSMYDPYTLSNGLPLQAVAPYVPLMPYPVNGLEVSNGSREPPPTGNATQSALLCEFKSNARSKRYEIKDIYGHVVEFSGDQHGSRFIQTKLETANSDEKDRIFREIEPNAIPLMTDVFGNYVIQKFFEHGDQTHKKILANKMRGHVLSLSLQMYGCRVVQKALDYVLVDQQAALVSELENHVIKCVKDQNGNHVIQKAIERCEAHTIVFITDAFRGQVQHLSIHPYGCRVIQRCLERSDTPSKAFIMAELMEGDCIRTMITDQYGNYVVQHVVSKDQGQGRQHVLRIVLNQLETFSKHKFASNVVEKCLEHADDLWRGQVVYTLMESSPRRIDGEGVLVSMIKDNFGNYVIQKLLDTLCPEDFASFVELLQPAVTQAKRTGCGKQMLSIEKKMHRFPSRYAYQLSLPKPPLASQFGSAATTPPLTADTQSLQSSAIPSVNGDAVEPPDHSLKGSIPLI